MAAEQKQTIPEKIWREIKRPFRQVSEVVTRTHKNEREKRNDSEPYVQNANLPKYYQEWRRYLDDERLYTGCHEKEKKELFAKYVSWIDLEVFSFCNRKCWFCQNSYIDRHSTNTFMSSEMYSRIIDELAQVNYSHTLTLTRYNEPFSDRIILDRIREARQKLPNAKLLSFTNGDYFTPELLEEANKAGLNSLYVTRYTPQKALFNKEEALKSLYDFAEKMCRPIEKQETNNTWARLWLLHPRMYIEVQNIAEKDYDYCSRAGAIKIPFKERVCRTIPCSSPFTYMGIDFNGSVMPCCNLRSDVPLHSEMVMGNVGENSLFEIYSNLRFSLLRYQLRDIGPKIFPCNICDSYKDARQSFDYHPPINF